MANSRNKGASFEREVANLLTADLGLEKNIRRILEQTREKHLYKFDRRPIKVRVPLGAINPALHLDSPFNADLLWDDFIFLLKELYKEDIRAHDLED